MSIAEGMLQAASRPPKLCVVDLDRTVWSSHNAASTQPPYRLITKCEVKDAHGETIRMHADTLQVMKALKGAKCRLGIASLNSNHERCCQLLAALGILSLFDAPLIKIRAGHGKKDHLSEIQACSGVAYRDMIFFDDLKANVNTASRLGITAVQVSALLPVQMLERALNEHAAAQRSRDFFNSWLVRPQLSPAEPSHSRKRSNRSEEEEAEMDREGHAGARAACDRKRRTATVSEVTLGPSPSIGMEGDGDQCGK